MTFNSNFHYNPHIYTKGNDVDNVDKLQLIKETLEKKGVSQTKLAELLGVNLTTVNNWFRRESIPSKYIDNISMLFNLNIDDIEDNGSLYTQPRTDNIPPNDIIEIKNTISTNVRHIEDNKRVYFTIDRTIIGLKELDNLRFNIHQSTKKYVDIIDISVDIYCGDGIYYIKYPHGLVPKYIKYNFSINTYTISDVDDFSSKLDINSFNGKLAGKVIARVEIFN